MTDKRIDPNRKDIRFGAMCQAINESKGNEPFASWVKNACQARLTGADKIIRYNLLSCKDYLERHRKINREVGWLIFPYCIDENHFIVNRHYKPLGCYFEEYIDYNDFSMVSKISDPTYKKIADQFEVNRNRIYFWGGEMNSCPYPELKGKGQYQGKLNRLINCFTEDVNGNKTKR